MQVEIALGIVCQWVSVLITTLIKSQHVYQLLMPYIIRKKVLGYVACRG